MKSFILSVVLLISGASFGQNSCSKLWLADASDSVDVFKKTAEQYLQTQLKPSGDPEVKTWVEFADKDNLNTLKIWLKPKKVAAGGGVATVYVISSLRATGVGENIQALFNALKEKVAGCITTPTDASFGFATGKVSIEKTGGDWSKKNLQMATLTISAK